jgi:hypothetical protein
MNFDEALPKLEQTDSTYSETSRPFKQKDKIFKRPCNISQVSGTDCEAETLLLMFKRWKKIEEDFLIKSPEGQERYDISKLPEVCDNIKYDMIHYPELRDDQMRERLLRLAQLMCMINVPFEYGITQSQKIKIGMKITHNLIDKIHHDLVWWKNLNSNELGSKKIKQNEDFQDENCEWDKKGLDHKSLDA